MPRRVLIDTSAWIDALRRDGDADVRSTVRSITAEGRAVICDMVRVELWNGAAGKAEQKLLRALEGDLECVPMTAEAWEVAVALAQACRKQGVTVPATDLIVAACARHYGVGLLHHDRHFDQIGGVLGQNLKTDPA